MWLNAKGHILFHGVVYNRGETLVIDSVSGLNERLAQHLDRYLIREQVVIADRTAAWRGWQLVGPGANDVLRGVGVWANCPRDRGATRTFRSRAAGAIATGE